MNEETARKLLEINRKFYDDFGSAFAATRRRIQPGIARIIRELPATERRDWCDLGCGSGALALAWARAGHGGSYVGLDFSEPSLAEARQVTAPFCNDHLNIRYEFADLMAEDWAREIPSGAFDGVFAFASLHHIPGVEARLRVFSETNRLLKDNGDFILSVWQFQNSPKLMKRVQPWAMAGLDEGEVDAGDYLLDWRFALPDSPEKVGLRYAHLFDEAELRELATRSGFAWRQSFFADGAQGNLALYAQLRKEQ